MTLHTVADAARLLGTSKVTVYRLVQRGDLAWVRVGGTTRGSIRIVDLERWIRARTHPGRFPDPPPREVRDDEDGNDAIADLLPRVRRLQ